MDSEDAKSPKGEKPEKSKKTSPKKETKGKDEDKGASSSKKQDSLDETSQPSSSSPPSSSSKDDESAIEMIRRYMAEKLGFSDSKKEESKKKVLDEVTINGIVKYLQSGECKNVIVMAGAGISTSAGIPDFRSPGSGLYDNLSKYKLPHPQAIFEIDFFKENPKPFFTLAKELFPGTYKPTPAHYFIRLLHDKGLLLRHYTQNIDGLEKLAGIPAEKIVEAHGTFYTSHCLTCQKEYIVDWVKEKIFEDEIPHCDNCSGLVKPDIVFFGENLPERFFNLIRDDFPKADLLIVMGSSLVVQPFASLVERVGSACPRLLMNKEKAGHKDRIMSIFGIGGGLDFDSEKNYRDVAFLGDCDDLCRQLVELLGWSKEYEDLITSYT